MSRKSWPPDMRRATTALPTSAAQSMKYLLVENKLKKRYNPTKCIDPQGNL